MCIHNVQLNERKVCNFSRHKTKHGQTYKEKIAEKPSTRSDKLLDPTTNRKRMRNDKPQHYEEKWLQNKSAKQKKGAKQNQQQCRQFIMHTMKQEMT